MLLQLCETFLQPIGSYFRKYSTYKLGCCYRQPEIARGLYNLNCHNKAEGLHGYRQSLISAESVLLSRKWCNTKMWLLQTINRKWNMASLIVPFRRPQSHSPFQAFSNLWYSCEAVNCHCTCRKQLL